MAVGRVAKRENRVRPGPVSAAEAARRTQLILAVATEEFLANGFEGATLAAIASRCRISKTTLYSLFESKEALFMHVTAAAIGTFSYDIQRLLDVQRPFEDVIHDVVELMVETSRAGPAPSLLRLIVAKGDHFTSLGQYTLDRTFELLGPLATYLQSVSGKKGFTSKEALQAAYNLMSMAVGGYGFLIVKPDLLYDDKKGWIKSVVQLFVAGFPVRPARITRRAAS